MRAIKLQTNIDCIIFKNHLLPISRYFFGIFILRLYQYEYTGYHLRSFRPAINNSGGLSFDTMHIRFVHRVTCTYIPFKVLHAMF